VVSRMAYDRRRAVERRGCSRRTHLAGAGRLAATRSAGRRRGAAKSVTGEPR
jgi:hypothetical protein